MVSVQSVNPDDDLMMITQNGTIVRISLEGLGTKGKTARGVNFMKLKEGDKIISATPVSKNESGGDEAEPDQIRTAQDGSDAADESRSEE